MVINNKYINIFGTHKISLEILLNGDRYGFIILTKEHQSMNYNIVRTRIKDLN